MFIRIVTIGTLLCVVFVSLFPTFNCSEHCGFRCTSDDMCLRKELVCNGQRDCADGSDESPLCGKCCLTSEHVTR